MYTTIYNYILQNREKPIIRDYMRYAKNRRWIVKAFKRADETCKRLIWE